MTLLMGLPITVSGLLFGYDTGLNNSAIKLPVFTEEITGDPFKVFNR